MKNFLQKLKWWQIGALVGLGIGLANLYFVVHLFAIRNSFAGAAMFGIFFELPVLPIFLLVEFLFSGFSLYFGDTVAFILCHLISWILGGIFYAYILRWIFRYLERKNRTN